MTWAVVGAGYSGVAVAAAMLEAGLDVDVLDARGAVGGLWRDGVYDDVQLITTRSVTAFPDHPMPPGPLFPSGPELLAYLESVAASCGIVPVARRVTSVTPAGSQWSVDGVLYDGVVLCTGLFTEPRIPALPGTLTVTQLHTADYKNASQLGDDVLVVGLGNSGADVAQQGIAADKRVTMAVDRGRHVLPRRVLGRPVVEMRRSNRVPDLPSRLALDAAVRVGAALWRAGRLPAPRHVVLSESPVVHSDLLRLVGTGALPVRPGVTSLDGSSVTFADGSSGTYDTVVWATGYTYSLPVDRLLLDGSSSPYGATPLSLVGGAWSPVSRGLAAVGHREPRHGRGPYLAAVASLVAAGALAQQQMDGPVGPLLGAPTAEALVDDGPELERLARMVVTARSA